MDFTKEDSRSASEIPQFLHLKNQATGEPIMDGKEPCGLMVFGTQSRNVQAKSMEVARAKMAAASDGDDVDKNRALETIHLELIESASLLVAECVNIDRGNEPCTTSQADLHWLFDLTFVSIKDLMAEEKQGWKGASFAQQVLRFAGDLGNYSKAEKSA